MHAFTAPPVEDAVSEHYRVVCTEKHWSETAPTLIGGSLDSCGRLSTELPHNGLCGVRQEVHTEV